MASLTRLRVLVLPALVAGLFATTLALAPAASAGRQERIEQARDVALNQIGDRYRYGAEGPRRFDCSGLVYFSYHRAGLDGVPRTSSQQAAHARRIPRENLRRGDLMFFRNDGGVYHVGIYLGRRDGDRMMLHAPGSGDRVRKDRPWTSRWFAGTLRRR